MVFQLKNNNDGKIIDHIFEHKSIIDTDNIFYIGDSKYYKSDKTAGKVSIYKQYTYAKNIIQFNIDLLNKNKAYENIRYRDEITEGYNISPNFFIYGYINNENNFDEPLLEKTGKVKTSFHFADRVFDRDTLFVLPYKINFLFVLKSYTSSNLNNVNSFRINTKNQFRNHFLEYFNLIDNCNFKFYEKDFQDNDLSLFVNNNFRLLNGKAIKIKENTLLIGIHKDDISLNNLIIDFTDKTFT